MQCVAVRCRHRPQNERWREAKGRLCCRALQCAVVCCSEMQCVAVCCSVLQAQTAECKVARSGREMCRCKRVSRSAGGRWCWRNRRRLGILPAHRERLHVKKRYTHWKRNLRAPKETCVPKKRRVYHRRDILTLRSSSCASGMVP